ncbi:MAG: hypothetical protein ABEK17_04285 [Candidatus Aenigmatarchaeota archaeon]
MKHIYRKIYKFIFRRIGDEIKREIVKKEDDNRFWQLHSENNNICYVFGGNDYFASEEIKKANLILK